VISLTIRIRIVTRADRARQLQVPSVIVSSHSSLEKKDRRITSRKKEEATLRWKAIYSGAWTRRSYYCHIFALLRCRLEHCYTAHPLQNAKEGENSWPQKEPYKRPSGGIYLRREADGEAVRTSRVSPRNLGVVGEKRALGKSHCAFKDSRLREFVRHAPIA